MDNLQKGFLKKINNKYSIDYNKTLSILSNRFHVDIIEYFKSEFKGNLLDLGCGEKPYSLIYNDLVKESIGVDVETCIHDISAVDVYASADKLPFNNNQFNCILCTNVLEHVSNLGSAFTEISRVLKPNGKVIISVPFLYPVHEKPHDFYRLTSYGIKALAEKNNIKVEKLIPIGGPMFLVCVWIFLILSRFEKFNILNYLNASIQNVIYRIYHKCVFSKYMDGNIPDINYIVSIGFFFIGEKQSD